MRCGDTRSKTSWQKNKFVSLVDDKIPRNRGKLVVVEGNAEAKNEEGSGQHGRSKRFDSLRFLNCTELMYEIGASAKLEQKKLKLAW